jgi:hypothetical protein
MDAVLTILDCPAYMDTHGTIRCGLPAAVEYRYTMDQPTGRWKARKSDARAVTDSTGR